MSETERSAWGEATHDYRDRQRAGIARAAMTLLAEHGGAGLGMSALAEAAGISRPTLYRYYRDLDSVLIDIAGTLAEHDAALAEEVLAQPDATNQLHAVLDALIHGAAHSPLGGQSLEAALPPAGRDLLRGHQDRVRELVAGILRRGVAAGDFAADVDPDADAPMILGLAGQADPGRIDRAHYLVGKLVQP